MRKDSDDSDAVVTVYPENFNVERTIAFICVYWYYERRGMFREGILILVNFDSKISFGLFCKDINLLYEKIL